MFFRDLIDNYEAVPPRIGGKDTRMLDRIQRTSPDGLSDLSGVSTPAQHEGSHAEPQMPDFHFAVNAGTIVTEPWTRHPH